MEITREKPSFGVLDGLKVVYQATEIAAPTAAAMMADWGADVVWIENTGVGDTMRDTAFIKEQARRNQRSVSMNPFSEEGKAVLLRLLEDADVFIEAGKGPGYPRRGLTDEVLWSANPRLVIVHVSGYGQTGSEERIHRPAYDHVMQAYGGYIAQNGTQEQPFAASPNTCDCFTASNIVGATLAGVYKASRTGRGESIDVAMFEIMARMGLYFNINYLNAGLTYPRPAERHQDLCGIGTFKCKDGQMTMVLYGVKQNRWMLERIGLGDLWGTEDYPEGTSALWLSSPKADLIQERIEEYMLGSTMDELEAELAAATIPASRVFSVRDMLADEHYRKRGVFIDWESADGRTVHGMKPVPDFKQNPGRVWRPMPGLGYDTRDVLSRAGYSDEEIERLAANGTIKLGD